MPANFPIGYDPSKRSIGGFVHETPVGAPFTPRSRVLHRGPFVGNQYPRFVPASPFLPYTEATGFIPPTGYLPSRRLITGPGYGTARTRIQRISGPSFVKVGGLQQYSSGPEFRSWTIEEGLEGVSAARAFGTGRSATGRQAWRPDPAIHGGLNFNNLKKYIRAGGLGDPDDAFVGTPYTETLGIDLPSGFSPLRGHGVRVPHTKEWFSTPLSGITDPNVKAWNEFWNPAGHFGPVVGAGAEDLSNIDIPGLASSLEEIGFSREAYARPGRLSPGPRAGAWRTLSPSSKFVPLGPVPSKAAGQQFKLLEAQTQEAYWQGRTWAEKKFLARQASVQFHATQTWPLVPYGPTEPGKPVPPGLSPEGGWKVQPLQSRLAAGEKLSQIASEYAFAVAASRGKKSIRRQMDQIIKRGQRIKADADYVGGATAEFLTRSANPDYLDYLNKRTTASPKQARLLRREAYKKGWIDNPYHPARNPQKIVTQMTISGRELERRRALGSVPLPGVDVKIAPVMPNDPRVRAVSGTNAFLHKRFAISPTLDMLQVEKWEGESWKPYTRKAAYFNREKILSTVIDAPVLGGDTGHIGRLIMGTHLTLDDSFIGMAEEFGIKGFHKATLRLDEQGRYVTEFGGQKGLVGLREITKKVGGTRYSRVPDLTTRKVGEMYGIGWSAAGLTPQQIQTSAGTAIEHMLSMEEIALTRGSYLGGPAQYSLSKAKDKVALKLHMAKRREELTRLSVTDPAVIMGRYQRMTAEHAVNRGASNLYEAGGILERTPGARPIPKQVLDQAFADKHGIRVWTAAQKGPWTYEHAGIQVRAGRHVNLIGDFGSNLDAIRSGLTPEIRGMIQTGELVFHPASFAKTWYTKTATGKTMPTVGVHDPLARKRLMAEQSGLGLQATLEGGSRRPGTTPAGYSRTGRILKKRKRSSGPRTGGMGLYPKNVLASLNLLDVAGTENKVVLPGGQILRPHLWVHQSFMQSFKETGELYMRFPSREGLLGFVSGIHVRAEERKLAFESSKLRGLARSKRAKATIRAVANLRIGNTQEFKQAQETLLRIVQSDVDLSRSLPARVEAKNALQTLGAYLDLDAGIDERDRVRGSSRYPQPRAGDMTSTELKEAAKRREFEDPLSRRLAGKGKQAQDLVQDALEELKDINRSRVEQRFALREARRLATGEVGASHLYEGLLLQSIRERKQLLRKQSERLTKRNLNGISKMLARKAKQLHARGKPRSLAKVKRRQAKVLDLMAKHHRIAKELPLLEELEQALTNKQIKLAGSGVGNWRGREQALAQALYNFGLSKEGVLLSTSATGPATLFRNLAQTEGIPVTDLAAKTERKGLARILSAGATEQIARDVNNTFQDQQGLGTGSGRKLGAAHQKALNKAQKAKAVAKPNSIWSGASEMWGSFKEAAADYDFKKMWNVLWGEGEELTWRRIGIGGIGAITAAALVGSVAQSMSEPEPAPAPMPSPGAPLPPMVNLTPPTPRMPMPSPRPVLEMPMSRTMNERVVMASQSRDLDPISFMQAPARGSIRVTQMNQRQGLYNHQLAQEEQDVMDSTIWNPAG